MKMYTKVTVRTQIRFVVLKHHQTSELHHSLSLRNHARFLSCMGQLLAAPFPQPLLQHFNHFVRTINRDHIGVFYLAQRTLPHEHYGWRSRGIEPTTFRLVGDLLILLRGLKGQRQHLGHSLIKHVHMCSLYTMSYRMSKCCLFFLTLTEQEVL